MINLTVAVYARKSKYSDRGSSVENQIALCKAYAQEHLENANEITFCIYKDDGFSGKNLDRPQFQAMLQDAGMQKFKVLICYRLDRISRSVSDFSALLETLEEKGVAFICIREQFDTTTPMGRAMMYIASVFSQLERETIAQRVTDNMLMLAKQGVWLGGTPPYGYKACRSRVCMVDGTAKSCCNLKKEPEQAKAVLQVFRTYLSVHTLQQASEHLNKQGVFTAQNRPFTLHSVRNIVTNPVYCAADQSAWDYFNQAGSFLSFTKAECCSTAGLLPYNRRNYRKACKTRNDKSRWILAMGKHEPLLPGEMWVQVQKKLRRAR